MPRERFKVSRLGFQMEFGRRMKGDKGKKTRELMYTHVNKANSNASHLLSNQLERLEDQKRKAQARMEAETARIRRLSLPNLSVVPEHTTSLPGSPVTSPHVTRRYQSDAHRLSLPLARHGTRSLPCSPLTSPQAVRRRHSGFSRFSLSSAQPAQIDVNNNGMLSPRKVTLEEITEVDRGKVYIKAGISPRILRRSMSQTVRSIKKHVPTGGRVRNLTVGGVVNNSLSPPVTLDSLETRLKMFNAKLEEFKNRKSSDEENKIAENADNGDDEDDVFQEEHEAPRRVPSVRTQSLPCLLPSLSYFRVLDRSTHSEKPTGLFDEMKSCTYLRIPPHAQKGTLAPMSIKEVFKS